MTFIRRSYRKQLEWFLGCLGTWQTELVADVRRFRERGYPTLATDLERLRHRVLDMHQVTGEVLDAVREVHGEVAERRPEAVP